MQEREKILTEPRFKPVAARLEARMLSLCYAAPLASKKIVRLHLEGDISWHTLAFAAMQAT